ncbi:hypothetical protein GGR26_002051 [Lewinella marina]|uniref:Uncharacterized protein n=1 Tax=Neolewinella marina TaxID=438751 RepID=A0A2G0CGY4_9BACT|nr:hypothetical protein [Neolewinella marina]NJB86283.1 hypothetical protein [Neolewinella marina]PHK99245.1 hypothetical protein CGL56_07250 [Neolewinella marina]
MKPADPTALELLRRDFPLPEGGMTEAELLNWLADRVDEALRLRPEYLMSLCYTLDLNEQEVQQALGSPAADTPPHRALARLLYERQCRRVATKRAIRPRPLTDPNAW